MRSFLEILRNIEYLPRINFQHKNIPYVAKGQGAAEDVEVFGGSRYEYDTWRPYMCGACCIKTIYDSVYPDDPLALFDIVKRGIDFGVYKLVDGGVEGAFHYPMRDLLRSMHIPAQVYGCIDHDLLVNSLNSGKLVVLSIDLAKSRHITRPETHLITLYGFDVGRAIFLVHDSSSIISANGNAASISQEYLEELSNHKGLIVG